MNSRKKMATRRQSFITCLTLIFCGHCRCLQKLRQILLKNWQPYLTVPRLRRVNIIVHRTWVRRRTCQQSLIVKQIQHMKVPLAPQLLKCVDEIGVLVVRITLQTRVKHQRTLEGRGNVAANFFNRPYGRRNIKVRPLLMACCVSQRLTVAVIVG